jgi:hypothetical protein
LSVPFISWINDELRKEIERRERIAHESAITTRVRTMFFGGVVALQALIIGWHY